MAFEPIRRLQVFRNGIVATASRDEIKEQINSLLDSGDLVLKDGEPIFVRYMQKSDEAPKGLFGLYYDVDDEFGNHYRGIKWIDDGNVNILTEGDEYVNLTYTENNGIYTISASANIVGLDDADCNACFLRIDQLPDGVDYLDSSLQRSLHVGDSINLDNCYENNVKIYLYDRSSTLVAESGLTVVNGRISYTNNIQGLTLTFVQGNNGLATACDVKSHIEYYEINGDIPLDGNNDPIPNRARIEVDPDSGLDEDGFKLNVYNLTIPISTQAGNCLTTSANGELYAPTTDSIADVRNIIVDPCPDGETVSFYYGYDQSSDSYRRISKLANNNWVYEDTGAAYPGKPSKAVECGHTYLVIRTTGGDIYMTQNDASGLDTKVDTFTNDNGTLKITQTDGSNPLTVTVSGLTPYLTQANVNWNNNNGSDSLSVTQTGIVSTNVISTLESYIDNYDCGTF